MACNKKLVIIETLGDGGIAHYTYNLATAIKLSGGNVILYTNKYYEFNDDILTYKTYKIFYKISYLISKYYPKFNSEIGFNKYLRRFIKVCEYPFNIIEALFISIKEKREIAHIQTVNELELLLIILFKLAGIKIIYTVHNIRPRHGKVKFYHFIIYNLIYRLCNHIIVHTKSGRNELKKFFKIKIQKISVLPHGNYQNFLPKKEISREKTLNLFDIPFHAKTILFFGAIRSNKGLENLLVSLSLIIKDIKNVKLLIIGEPTEDYGKYDKIIKQKKIEKYIYEKLEYVDNSKIHIYFTAADLVVLPYHEITGSGVLQIAYAFSKPVVATDLPGFREAINDGENGYLVPVNNSIELANRIIDILQDEPKAEKMGRYSKFLSDTMYSWDSIASRTLSLYSRI